MNVFILNKRDILMCVGVYMNVCVSACIHTYIETKGEGYIYIDIQLCVY